VEQLALGLAAITLVAFVGLTTMHERYAYPAFVFLLLAATQRPVAIAWAVFAVVFLLNLVAAVPPEGWVLPDMRLVSSVGAIAITGVAVTVVAAAGGMSGRDGPRTAAA
jgi:hypothetical protein